MRKIILALALILSMGFSNTAQAFSFDWGVTGGYNLTKLKLDGELDKSFNSENRSGWFVGAKVNLGLFLGFGVDGAVVYSQSKMNLTGESKTSSSETLRSFELPINLKYSIGLGRIASIYAATGPQFNFNLGSDNWYKEDLKRSFDRENMTTSWNVGLGAKLLKHFDLGVVYNFGITKMGESILNAANIDNVKSDAKANSFKVQLTYFF